MTDALVTAVNVKFVVKPECRDEFLQHLRHDADATLANEPGSLQFVVGQDVKDPHVIHLHEQYKTRQDYEFHQTTPHFQAFASFLTDRDPLQEPAVVVAYQCQHAPQSISPRPAYCLNVESRPKPEYQQAFATLMTSHQACSLAEPLCLQFDYGVAVDEEPHVYHQHEQFTGLRDGLEGFEAHQQGAHFERFMEFNRQDPYTQPQQVYLFQTLFVDKK